MKIRDGVLFGIVRGASRSARQQIFRESRTSKDNVLHPVPNSRRIDQLCFSKSVAIDSHIAMAVLQLFFLNIYASQVYVPLDWYLPRRRSTASGEASPLRRTL